MVPLSFFRRPSARSGNKRAVGMRTSRSGSNKCEEIMVLDRGFVSKTDPQNSLIAWTRDRHNEAGHIIAWVGVLTGHSGQNSTIRCFSSRGGKILVGTTSALYFCRASG